MKNLFNNLLLNSRFVFQNAGEKPQPAPEAEAQKPDEFAKFLENQPPLEQVIAKAKETKNATQNMATKERNKAQDDYAKAQGANESFITAEGVKVYKLGETVIQAKANMEPDVAAKFDELMAKLEGAKTDKARAKLLKAFANLAQKDPVTKKANSAVTDFYTSEGERLSDAEVNATLASRETQLAKLHAEGMGEKATKILNAFATNSQLSELFKSYIGNPKELMNTFENKMTALMNNEQYDRALDFSKNIKGNADGVLNAWNSPEFGDKNGRIISAGNRLKRNINNYQA